MHISILSLPLTACFHERPRVIHCFCLFIFSSVVFHVMFTIDQLQSRRLSISFSLILSLSLCLCLCCEVQHNICNVKKFVKKTCVQCSMFGISIVINWMANVIFIQRWCFVSFDFLLVFIRCFSFLFQMYEEKNKRSENEEEPPQY